MEERLSQQSTAQSRQLFRAAQAYSLREDVVLPRFDLIEQPFIDAQQGAQAGTCARLDVRWEFTGVSEECAGAGGFKSQQFAQGGGVGDGGDAEAGEEIGRAHV